MATEIFKGPDRRFLILLERTSDNEKDLSKNDNTLTEIEKINVNSVDNVTGFDDSERTTSGLVGNVTTEGGIASGCTKLVLPKDYNERKKMLMEELKKETSNMRVCERVGVIKDSVKQIVKEAYLKSKELSKINKVEEYTIMPLVVQKSEETEYEVELGKMTDYLHLENSVRREINTIKRRLLDIVIDEMAPRWVPGAKRGKRIDRRIIARAELGQEDFFKYKLETDILNVAFFLLIDESGSMYGEKEKQARRCAIMFGKVLSSVNMPHMIAGFSTYRLTEGQEKKAQRDVRYSQCESRMYNRAENLMHNIYKRFDEPYNKVKTKLVNIRARVSNYDQDHIEWAWQHLQKYCLTHNIERKVLIVISDGMPCGGTAGREKLIRVINEIGCDPNAEIIGIGIKTEYVKDFYHKCIEINNVCELGGNVVKLLESAIKKGRRQW